MHKTIPGIPMNTDIEIVIILTGNVMPVPIRDSINAIASAITPRKIYFTALVIFPP